MRIAARLKLGYYPNPGAAGNPERKLTSDRLPDWKQTVNGRSIYEFIGPISGIHIIATWHSQPVDRLARHSVHQHISCPPDMGLSNL